LLPCITFTSVLSLPQGERRMLTSVLINADSEPAQS
jgi:hypothetical protein